MHAPCAGCRHSCRLGFQISPSSHVSSPDCRVTGTRVSSTASVCSGLGAVHQRLMLGQRIRQKPAHSSLESFKAIPVASVYGLLTRIGHSNVFERVASPAEVARCAGKNQILEFVRTPMRVGKNMVVLRPHRLESGMLFLVAHATPPDNIRVRERDALANFRSDDGDATEPA